MTKKPLLVTLADRNYLNQAKQVFAGAYFNAGWQGDYMLLAHDIPEKNLAWFRKKGILVKHCKPLYAEMVGNTPTPVSFMSRFYLFTPEFKKWSTIIYLDADIIVRASLDRLIGTKSLGAACDVSHSNLKSYLIDRKRVFSRRGIEAEDYFDLMKQLKKNYSLNKSLFSAGMFVFNPNLINKNTFKQLLDYVNKYQDICQYADQFALNLHFYGKWKELFPVYNFYIYHHWNQWHVPLNKVKAILLHFIGPYKPWETNSQFYREWSRNLRLADKINLKKISEGKKWSQSEIVKYSRYLRKREILFGIFAFWLRFEKPYYWAINFFEKKCPSIFKVLKRTKKRIKLVFR